AQTAFNAGQLGTAPVSKQVRTFRDLRFRELMPQQYDFSCGSAALGSVLQYGYGIETDEQEMIRRMMVGVDPRQAVQNGFSMLDLKGYKHFVVVKGADAGRVFVADPALGHRVMNERDFVEGWNGIVLAVVGDRPMDPDSYLVNSRSSPALQRRVDALDRATTP